MTLDDIQALTILKASQQIPPFIETSRTESRELFALLEGTGFIKELINRIEFIESEKKSLARKKYSRDITPFYERLLRPVDNVYSATGGSVVYNIEDKEKRMSLMKKISRIRSGKSLREWLKANWMPLYHSDPNGVIFMEYESGDKEGCWPTYKNINFIRNYVSRGQMVEWILFDPVDTEINGDTVKVWRLVDDKMDRRYRQDGDTFTLLDEISGIKVTFEHPFGTTPAIINSDIEKLTGDNRLSPIHKIVELSKEYARDQSIKTLYKKFNGFPKEWKYVDQCKECVGAKKDSDGNVCKSCDGHGYYTTDDVTDIVTLAIPEKDEVQIDPISGYIVPPLDIWNQYNNELDILDKTAHETHWGTVLGIKTTGLKTATEVILNSQPMINKLDGYSDTGEFIETALTELIANFVDQQKPRDEKIASISYPRRYIIDPPDVILQKYQEAKKNGDNNVILDRLFNEYITAKFRNDPEFLRVTLLKSEVEPYLHLDNQTITDTFGGTEAQKKVMFEDWWKTLTRDNFKETSDKLKEAFEQWFEDQQPEEEANADTLKAQAELRGSVGGATAINQLIISVSTGGVPKDSAIKILEITYGYKEEEAKAIVGNPTVIPTVPTTGDGNN